MKKICESDEQSVVNHSSSGMVCSLAVVILFVFPKIKPTATAAVVLFIR